ncbi:MAG: YkvA family protein [Desulfosudaceae bacterium]
MCGAIAYILFPFDLLPDYIPGYGQIDDAIVALGCLFFLEKDLTVYKAWRNHQGG